MARYELAVETESGADLYVSDLNFDPEESFYKFQERISQRHKHKHHRYSRASINRALGSLGSARLTDAMPANLSGDRGSQGLERLEGVLEPPNGGVGGQPQSG